MIATAQDASHHASHQARDAVRTMPIGEGLKDIIAEVLNLDPGTGLIGEDTNLFDLGIDSMAVMNLVMAVQERFGVEIPEESLDARLFERFGNLRAAIEIAAAH